MEAVGAEQHATMEERSRPIVGAGEGGGDSERERGDRDPPES